MKLINVMKSKAKEILNKIKRKKYSDDFSDINVENSTTDKSTSAEQFINSLNAISADDIVPPKSKKQAVKIKLTKAVIKTYMTNCA